MRIDTHVDLDSAWDCCTLLGKIFFFPLLVVAFVIIFITSVYVTAIVEFGHWAGFLVFDDEPKEDEETDSSDSEMDT